MLARHLPLVCASLPVGSVSWVTCDVPLVPLRGHVGVSSLPPDVPVYLRVVQQLLYYCVCVPVPN